MCTDGEANITQGVVTALCYDDVWYTVSNNLDSGSQLNASSTITATILGALLGLLILVGLSLVIISVSVWIICRHRKEDNVNSVLG